MATPDIRNVLRNPGRFCINPTDLTAPYPHGAGTPLGTIRTVSAIPGVTHQDITAEEFGAEIVDKVYIREAWNITGILREFDSDALSTIFRGTATGASGNKTINYPASVRGGALVSDSSVVLCFSPDDIDHGGRMILFYRALPMVDEAAELQNTINDNLEVAIAFVGIRDASGRVVSIGKRQDLSL